MSVRLAPLTLALGLALCASASAVAAGEAKAPAKPAYKAAGEILAASPAADWRTPDPENLLYMDLPSGRVVMELAPGFVPLHAANIRALVREKYFDGLAIIRSQDNYVVQWGDPEEDEKKARPLGSAKASLDPEFSVPVGAATPFTNRVAISSVPLSTNTLSSDAPANTASAINRTRRRPSRSAVRPPSSSSPP